MKIVLTTLLLGTTLLFANSSTDSDVLNFNRADLKKIKYLQSKRIIERVEAKKDRKIDYSKDFAVNLNAVSKKTDILNSIDSYSQEDFNKAYTNVLSFLENKQQGSKTIDIYKNQSMKSYLEKHYKDMLKAIAYTESDFRYPVGLIDKDDVSYFQINIKQGIWDIDRLEKITQLNNLSRQKLIDDYNLAGKVALHVLLYNISLYASNNNIAEPKYHDLKRFIASYNHPFKLKEYYMASAEEFLASL